MAGMLLLPQLLSAYCYVNTELPGINKKINPKTGEECWYDGMGNCLCTVEESMPLKEIDKFYLFLGDQENEWVKKEWDSKRDCYVWRTIDGDFLGTDPKSLSEADKKWLAEVDLNWFGNNDFPADINEELLKIRTVQKLKEYEEELAQLEKEEAEKKASAKKEASEKAKAESKLREADKQIGMTDAEIDKAQREIDKARAELRKLGMTEYESELNKAQAALDQAKAASKTYKDKRKK